MQALLTLTQLEQVVRMFMSEEDTVVALTAQPQLVAPAQEIQLIITSSLQHTLLLGAAINSLCTSLALSQVDAYQIELCAVEAATNAIKHAYNNRPGFPVQVTLTVHPDKLVLVVCDEGQAMPDHAAPSLNFDPVDLEHLPESGMGLFLIHRIMDEVSYGSWHGINVLTMTKKLLPRRVEAGG